MELERIFRNAINSLRRLSPLLLMKLSRQSIHSFLEELTDQPTRNRLIFESRIESVDGIEPGKWTGDRKATD
jgi:hypothetical protein